MPKNKMLSDETVLKALEKCISKACIPAAVVAGELDVNSRYAKDRLLELQDKGLVEGIYRGSSWCFRPK